jgi:hypothetical protein
MTMNTEPEKIVDIQSSNDQSNSNTDSDKAIDSALNDFIKDAFFVDANGNQVVLSEQEVKEAFEAFTNAENSIDISDLDEEDLIPFALPENYHEKPGRESLSDTTAYSEHLNEHWGF